MSYWTRTPRGGHRRRRLAVADITDAALALLADGRVELLTLRALATRLGVAQSSLYAHVTSREDVLDLALDAALAADARVRTAMRDADLRTLLLAWYDHLVAHPWAAAQVARTTPLGPTYLELADRVCQLLGQAGVPPADLLTRSYAVTSFVLGCATIRVANTGGGYAESAALAELPALRQAVAAGAPSWRGVVERGLDTLLPVPSSRAATPAPSLEPAATDRSGGQHHPAQDMKGPGPEAPRGAA